MPLYPHLFAICGGGVAQARIDKRFMAGDKTYPFVQSVGRFGL